MAEGKFSYQFVMYVPGYLDRAEFVGNSCSFDEPLKPGQGINIDFVNYRIDAISDEDLARTWFARAYVSPL